MGTRPSQHGMQAGEPAAHSWGAGKGLPQPVPRREEECCVAGTAAVGPARLRWQQRLWRIQSSPSAKSLQAAKQSREISPRRVAMEQGSATGARSQFLQQTRLPTKALLAPRGPGSSVAASECNMCGPSRALSLGTALPFPSRARAPLGWRAPRDAPSALQGRCPSPQ